MGRWSGFCFQLTDFMRVRDLHRNVAASSNENHDVAASAGSDPVTRGED